MADEKKQTTSAPAAKAEDKPVTPEAPKAKVTGVTYAEWKVGNKSKAVKAETEQVRVSDVGGKA